MKPAHLRRANALLDARSGLQYALTRVAPWCSSDLPIAISALTPFNLPRDLLQRMLEAAIEMADKDLAELGVDTSDLQGV